MNKSNEKFRWLAKTAIVLIIIAIGAAVAWGVLKERVNNNRDRIVVVEKKSDENKTATVEMKTDIKYIKEAVVRIETKLDK